MMSIPERFGKYVVSEMLGRGAMGAVYKAFDPDIRRHVAIKTLRLDVYSSPTGSLAARFRKEAQAAGRLAHPGIVTVFEFGECDECAFIAMEYVQGCNLREYFQRKTAFEEGDIVSIMVQLLEALTHAHERKVWHRDIKPSNLIVTNSGKLKITDFGIARIEAEITQTFTLMGTPGYIPPEMYRGEAIDHRVDLFAAGAVMYELLAGKAPFDGGAESVMFNVCNEDPPPLADAERCARWTHYAPLVMKALARAPDRRFQTAASFRDAILAAYAQPVSATVSEGTIIVSPGRKHAPADSYGSSPSKPGSTGERGTPWPPGWDPTTLNSVESRLASVVGPLAHELVQKAARRCGDLDALLSAIAKSLPDSGERRAFLSGASTAPSGSGTQGLACEEIERAVRVLSRHLGPLARVIVKRASEKTDDLERFHELIAEGVSTDADRQAFLRDIRVRR
jgi:eukaryotic-like serine/threonine-protein kinase